MREAEQTGTAQCALAKTRLRFAKASICGVSALGCPSRKPTQSLRSSMQIISTFGLLGCRSSLAVTVNGKHRTQMAAKRCVRLMFNACLLWLVAVRVWKPQCRTEFIRFTGSHRTAARKRNEFRFAFFRGAKGDYQCTLPSEAELVSDREFRPRRLGAKAPTSRREGGGTHSNKAPRGGEDGERVAASALNRSGCELNSNESRKADQ